MRLIDADALCDAMYHEAFENDASYNESNPKAKWDSGLWIRYKMFENAIADAPTIEPKRGEWIFNGNFCGLNHHKCSKCGKNEFRMSNFCPNCGADMKGADDE